ncbi:hypothetical protein ACRERI_01835 [Methanothermobacter thermautotrophicus]|uniref:hypothetical protein n=1 Tax=Methanothermobacter thermautotrophicus TaxID=145262 RepID=UPI003D7F2992
MNLRERQRNQSLCIQICACKSRGQDPVENWSSIHDSVMRPLWVLEVFISSENP